MSEKHTPGPWTRGTDNWSSHVIAPTEYGSPVLAVFSGRGREEDDANAALTAAAPDMLEALEFWINYTGDELDVDFEPICRSAIAKARGQG